jgi:hypothetical protein
VKGEVKPMFEEQFIPSVVSLSASVFVLERREDEEKEVAYGL